MGLFRSRFLPDHEMTVKPGDYSLRPARWTYRPDFSVIDELVRPRPGQGAAACTPWPSVREGATGHDLARCFETPAGSGIDERRRIAMFAAAECLFMYVESSLRVGSGEDRRDLDLPIQREAATGYPLLPGSSLKGVLRARARSQQAPVELMGLLGSAPESEEKQPSSVVVSDALPLLFPVRSLTGLFAWVTSVETWSRFQRDLAAYGVTVPAPPQLPALAPETAGVAPESPLLCQQANPGPGGAELSDSGRPRRWGPWAPGWRSTPSPTTRSSTSGGSGRRAGWCSCPRGRTATS